MKKPDLTECFLGLFPRYRNLKRASTMLYEAGYWQRNGTLEWQDEDYWDRLKKALNHKGENQ